MAWEGWNAELTETARRLHFEQGVSALEISRQFGCTKNTVCGHLSRRFGKLPKGEGTRRRRENGFKVAAATNAKKGAQPKRPKGIKPPRALPQMGLDAPTDARPTAFRALGARRCKWPIEDASIPGTADMRCCGAEAVEDRPYCQTHIDRSETPLTNAQRKSIQTLPAWVDAMSRPRAA